MQRVIEDSNLGDEGAIEETPSSTSEVQLPKEPDIVTMLGAQLEQVAANIYGRLDNQSRYVQSHFDKTANAIVALETKMGEAWTNAELTRELTELGYDKEQVAEVKASVKAKRELAEKDNELATLRQKAEVKPEQDDVGIAKWNADYYIPAVEPRLIRLAFAEGLISAGTPAQLTETDWGVMKKVVPHQLDDVSYAGYARLEAQAELNIKAESEALEASKKPRINVGGDRPVGGNDKSDQTAYDKWVKGEGPEPPSAVINRLTARYAKM